MWRLRVLLFKLKLCILCTGNHTHTHTYTQCSLLSNTVTVYILNSQQSPVCFKPQTNNTLLHTVVIDTDDIWTVLWLSAPHPLTLLPSYPHSLVIRPCVFLSSSFPFHSLLSLVLVVCLIFFFFFPCLAAAIINSLHAVMADWSDGPIPLSFLLDGGCYSK